MTGEPGWIGLNDQGIADALIALLDLESSGGDVFIGHTPELSMRRVFGGQVAAQALVAAGRTVAPDRSVHSLHSYFLRGGDPSQPICYRVERARDGGSFSVRRVIAEQDGSTIFVLSASFQLAQDGIDHQPEMPEMPEPESLPSLRLADSADSSWEIPMPFDIRAVNTSGSPLRLWLKARGQLPEDPLIHVCAVTFASDLSLLNAVLNRQGLNARRDQVLMASLDHAMWFHRRIRADEWFLYVTTSPSASGGRGFATGRIFSADGRHLVSVAQEGVFRLLDA